MLNVLMGAPTVHSLIGLNDGVKKCKKLGSLVRPV